MFISGPLTLKNYGETDAVLIPDAYAKIMEGPSVFAAGFFVAKVGFYRDDTFSDCIFEVDIVTNSPEERATLEQAVVEWAPEMTF